jgi:uncharacterized protein (TIGR03083 family)
MGTVDVATHVDQVEQHGRALGDAAERAGLEADVPTCPTWTVRTLLGHAGMVQRWAATHVRDGTAAFTNGESPGFPAPADGTLEWYREGHAALVDALRAAPADLVAMTFLADAGAPRAFWARRQAHEAAIHRSDAEAALGTTPEFDRDFALDGIAELLEGFYARGRGKLVADPPVTMRVAPDDADTSWRVEIRPDGRVIERNSPDPVDAELSGRASELYLNLWNRGSAGAVTVAGDADVAALWHRLARVQWG